MSVYVFLNDTYADWELGYLLPELLQHQRKAVTFGLTRKAVKSLGSLMVTPEISLSDIDLPSVQAVILPGGLFWKNFESPELDVFVKELRARRIPIAGICAATGYLARLGMLDSVTHTSNSPAFLKERSPSYTGGARYLAQMAASDDGIITAGGLGAVDFTYEILSALKIGDQKYRDTWYRMFKHGEEPREEQRENQAASWTNVVSLESLTFERDGSVPESYTYETAPAAFSSKLGAKKLGWNVALLPPGKFSCPYHFHHSEEEVFLVLEGRAILRQPNGYREIEKGDLIFFATTPEGAHQIYNHTDKPLKYLALSSLDPLDLGEFPDSGKISVRKLKQVFQAGSAVDYWTDEKDPARFWPSEQLRKR